MTNASIIVEALAEHFRDAHSAALPAAFRIVVERLRDRFGTKLVDRALQQYEKAMGRERQRLKRENRRLERQVARARAAYLRREIERS
jgi:hypothetical protein